MEDVGEIAVMDEDLTGEDGVEIAMIGPYRDRWGRWEYRQKRGGFAGGVR